MRVCTNQSALNSNQRNETATLKTRATGARAKVTQTPETLSKGKPPFVTAYVRTACA